MPIREVYNTPSKTHKLVDEAGAAGAMSKEVGTIEQGMSSVVVTPPAPSGTTTAAESPSSPAESCNSSRDEEGELGGDNLKIVAKTAHKHAEENGEHRPEPLLKENPLRFVLFPIQDNDVSWPARCPLFLAVSFAPSIHRPSHLTH